MRHLDLKVLVEDGVLSWNCTHGCTIGSRNDLYKILLCVSIYLLVS